MLFLLELRVVPDEFEVLALLHFAPFRLLAFQVQHALVQPPIELFQFARLALDLLKLLLKPVSICHLLVQLISKSLGIQFGLL